MKKVPSTPSLLGTSPPAHILYKSSMRKSTSTQSMLSDTPPFIPDVVEEIKIESMIHSPLNNTFQCIEQYGFPSEILQSKEKDMAACLMSGEDVSHDMRRTLNIEMFDKYVQRVDTVERYERLFAIVRRRKRRLSI
jgi:hypothetical protein